MADMQININDPPPPPVSSSSDNTEATSGGIGSSGVGSGSSGSKKRVGSPVEADLHPLSILHAHFNGSSSSNGSGSSTPNKKGRKSVTFASNTHPPQENHLAISITKHEVVKFPENFVEYTVFVHEGGHPVKVLLRRYRQFERLHQDVKRENAVLGIAEHLLPELPKKRWFSKQRWINRWDEGATCASISFGETTYYFSLIL